MTSLQFHPELSTLHATRLEEAVDRWYRRSVEHGQGRPEDLDLLRDVAGNIQGRTICALGDAAAMPVQ